MDDRSVLARRMWRDVVVAAAIASLTGGGVLLVFLVVLTSPDVAANTQSRLSFLIAIVFIVVAEPAGYVHFRRVMTATTRWLSEGREPTPDEREKMLSLAGRLTMRLFVPFVAAALIFGGLNIVFPGTAVARAVQVAGTVVLGGLATCMVFFLIVERRMRPAFALALSGAPPERPATIGVRPRLVLSWALGSGVVLVGLVMLPLTQHPHFAVSVVFLAVVGLVAGLLLTVMAARSVVDPIEDVRAGLRRVQNGDLDVSVTVDDGGEIGLLQAGFNEMVVGLRERVLLRDLLDRHVGDEVARYAVEHGVGLGGEVREVSALFVDVVGSTALAQSRPATEVVGLLNELFRRVVDAVAAEGGWVNKFEGDAALCVFGAPTEQPDHAARALRAARRLRAGLAAWRGVDAGIGVSSGAAVAGTVGTDERYEYTVIGDPVNEAARLSDAAKTRPERVLASGTCVTMARGVAGEWTAAGSQTLRGRAAPTELWVPAEI
jgi:adenylate cyclase